MSDLALFAVRSSWGVISLTWHLWVLIIAFAYALILIAAWAVIHGGQRKPTPPPPPEGSLQARIDALREMGADADLAFREPEPREPRIEWTPGGGWRLR